MRFSRRVTTSRTVASPQYRCHRAPRTRASSRFAAKPPSPPPVSRPPGGGGASAALSHTPNAFSCFSSHSLRSRRSVLGAAPGIEAEPATHDAQHTHSTCCAPGRSHSSGWNVWLSGRAERRAARQGKGCAAHPLWAKLKVFRALTSVSGHALLATLGRRSLTVPAAAAGFSAAVKGAAGCVRTPVTGSLTQHQYEEEGG